MLSGPTTLPADSAPAASGPVPLASTTLEALSGPVILDAGWSSTQWSGSVLLSPVHPLRSSPVASGFLCPRRRSRLMVLSGPVGLTTLGAVK